jgi:NDP-sugar pyrophosphorylase family protein
MIKYAMILAAGYGKRLHPLTLDKPKALIEINGCTLLEICIKKLIRQGIDKIMINVHYLGDQIRYFLEENNNFNISIALSEEKELLDTGAGIKNVSFFFKDCKHFLVHNVDIISEVDIQKMYLQHINRASLATLAVSKRWSSRYLLFDNTDSLCGRLLNSEKEQQQEMSGRRIKKYAFSGIHIISKEIFPMMPSQNIFSIMELYLSIMENHRISPFIHEAAHWFDVGKISDMEHIRKALKDKELC